MVELILEDYCQECREMDIKTDVNVLYSNEDEATVHISLHCSKAKRCAAQVRYLERRYKGHADASE